MSKFQKAKILANPYIFKKHWTSLFQEVEIKVNPSQEKAVGIGQLF